MPTALYLPRTATLRRALDRHHLTHQRFAAHLGLSRSHWSQLFNRRRALTPTMRRTLLSSRYLKDVPEADLWDVREPASVMDAHAP